MESTDQDRPVPRWFTAAAIAVLLWEMLGCVMYLMQVSVDPATLPVDQRAMWDAAPTWMMAAYAVAVWVGLVGAILLYRRHRLAEPLLLVSLVAVIVQFSALLLVPELRNLTSPRRSSSCRSSSSSSASSSGISPARRKGRLAPLSTRLRLHGGSMSTFTIDSGTSRATPTPVPGKRMTVPAIRARKANGATAEPLVMLTAYTMRMAQLLDPHCEMLLVGDSLGQVIYGLPSTVPGHDGDDVRPWRRGGARALARSGRGRHAVRLLRRLARSRPSPAPRGS